MESEVGFSLSRPTETRSVLFSAREKLITGAALRLGLHISKWRRRKTMIDTWEWRIRIRRSGRDEYEDAESQQDHRRPAELHEVIDVVVGDDRLHAVVGDVQLSPQDESRTCQVMSDEVQMAEIEGFSLEGKTEDKIWAVRSADSHVVVFTLSEDGMGLTGESQLVPNPNSPLEREVIAAPARRAAYQFLRKLRAIREQ
jgi:hypothetical protein